MQTWKLELEYDGTRYRGWQQQKNARSVQGELLKAAESALQTKVEIGGAGRTDAGVHALRQVAHLKVRAAQSPNLTPPRLRQAFNDALPHDINVLTVQTAPRSFHARHDAATRYYLYQIATRRSAFAKPYVWWVKDRLDLNAMQRAAALLVGRHDFRSFCESPAQQPSTLVQVELIEWAVAGDLFLLRIGASHYLWKMVRRVVGTLVEAGRGRLTAADMARLLTTESRETAPWTAPPSGLFLEYVQYPGEPPPGILRPAFPVG